MTIKEFIDKKKLSYQQMADEIGVSKQIIMSWYKGVCSPRLLHAVRINELSKKRVKFTDMLCKNDLRKLK